MFIEAQLSSWNLTGKTMFRSFDLISGDIDSTLRLLVPKVKCLLVPVEFRLLVKYQILQMQELEFENGCVVNFNSVPNFTKKHA
jgi:hypothetical protein